MRKKSRHNKKRGGSIFTKKICIDAPKDEADAFSFGKHKVSKKDLDHIIKSEKKPGYHFFRRTFRKGVCLTQDEFAKVSEEYFFAKKHDISNFVNEETINAFQKKLKEYEKLKGQPEPKNEKPLFQGKMGEHPLFDGKSIEKTHPELFKGGKKRKTRGGSFFTKKICINSPVNEGDKTLFGDTFVSKDDLKKIRQNPSPKFHFFRNFSRKKGLCLKPADFVEKLKEYDNVNPVKTNTRAKAEVFQHEFLER